MTQKFMRQHKKCERCLYRLLPTSIPFELTDKQPIDITLLYHAAQILLHFYLGIHCATLEGNM